MSAFDLLSFKPQNAAVAPAPAAPPLAESSPRDAADRSFRETLSDAKPAPADARPPRAPADADATRAEVNAEVNEADAAEANAADAETANTETEATAVDATAEAALDESADVAADDADGGESPVGELVLDLIAAFENVLENNPLAQAVDGAGGGRGEDGNVLSSLAALFQALGAVSTATGTAAGQGLAGAAGPNPAGLAQGVAPIGNPTNTAAGSPPVPTVAPELAPGQQAQADGQSAGNQNNPGQTPNGNPALQTAESGPLSLNANTSAGLPLPGFDAAASNTAAQPITPLVNATPAGTDLSARLNPAGLTDPNATNDGINSARLTRGLNNAVNQQGGTVTLRLTPPDLGTVRIQLNMQGTNVTAQFHAETDSAQRLLTQQLGQLRASLESQGLNVEKLGVQAMSASFNSSSLQQQAGGDNPQSQANADGRSRGQFGQSSQQNNQGREGNPDDNAAPANFTQLLTPDSEPDLETDLDPAASLTGVA